MSCWRLIRGRGEIARGGELPRFAARRWPTRSLGADVPEYCSVTLSTAHISALYNFACSSCAGLYVV